MCGETPRLKVVPFRGRPWNLCLNEECPSMEEMRKRRAEREAARAAKEDSEKIDGDGASGDGAKADGAKVDSAGTKTRARRSANGRRSRSGKSRSRSRS
jgi:hypothetical protein